MATADIATGTASGALAGSSFGPVGTAVGAGIGLVGGIMSSNSKKKAAKARADMLKKQADRRIKQGEQEAQNIFDIGQRDQTAYAAQSATAGRSRTLAHLDMGLEIIATRAANELSLALENAQYEAEMIRADAEASIRNSRSEQTADYLNMGAGLLRQYGEYNNRYGATSSAQAKTSNYNSRSPAIG